MTPINCGFACFGSSGVLFNHTIKQKAPAQGKKNNISQEGFACFYPPLPPNSTPLSGPQRVSHGSVRAPAGSGRNPPGKQGSLAGAGLFDRPDVFGRKITWGDLFASVRGSFFPGWEGKHPLSHGLLCWAETQPWSEVSRFCVGHLIPRLARKTHIFWESFQ